jgi:L-ribulose-5-phosphate 4-epimerase
MLEALKQDVCAANLRLVDMGLVFLTWGNVSGVDRDSGTMVIKPSGVSYDGMQPEQMVVVSLETGEVVEGDLRPSSDTPTHLELYRVWPDIGGVVHTHSTVATAWAQAGREITPMGTTHADFAPVAIPCTRMLRAEEIREQYEANTGRVILERFAELNPAHVPAVLVAGHGPFAWGASADKAVTHAGILEEVARMAGETLRINPETSALPGELIDKHFSRKHGPDAYYGQG